MRLDLVLVVTLAWVTPVMAEDTVPEASQQAQPTSEASAKKPKVQMICEDEERIGTRLETRRVCHPAGDDRQFRQETRDSIDGIQRNPALQR
jgi:hypothetical protein